MAVLSRDPLELLAAPVRILAVGDELLRGDQVDSNSAYAARRLTALGHTPEILTQVPDKAGRAQSAVADWRRRGGVLIVGGGLGPTEDDATRDEIAAGLGVPLVENARALEWIRERSRRARRDYTEHTWRQALLPGGMEPVFNAQGTAPGMFLPAAAGKPGFLLVLPGVPREYRSVIDDLFPPDDRLARHEQWRLAGLGEDALAARLEGFPGREALGFYPSLKGYRLRVPLARPGEADPVDREALAARIDDWLVSREDEPLESRLVAMLRDRNETLAVAESCTAGLLGARIGDVPGASDVFLGGFLTYADRVKTAQLGVPADLIARHGAVSPETARAMAAGARERLGADWALSVTGIAGPGGERPGKPVGTVHIGLAGPDGEEPLHRHVVGAWDRQANREFAVLSALTLLWRTLRGSA